MLLLTIILLVTLSPMAALLLFGPGETPCYFEVNYRPEIYAEIPRAQTSLDDEARELIYEQLHIDKPSIKSLTGMCKPKITTAS